MKTIIISSMAALSLLAGSATAQTVYRSVDENGEVSYSDRPAPETKSEAVELEWQRTNSAETAKRVAANQEQYAAAAEESDSAAEEQTMLKEEAAKVAAQRRENCNNAREQAERYATARRLYRETPDGGRDYLNDKELTQARVDARRQVDEWCGGG